MSHRLALGLVAVLLLALTGCVQEGQDRRTGSPTDLLSPAAPPEVAAERLADVPKGKLLPLREGEKRMTLRMPEPYTPSAPHGTAPTTTAASCSTPTSTRTSG